MKKAKSWLALPLAVCMLAVMIFSVAEAKEITINACAILVVIEPRILGLGNDFL